MRSRAHRRTAAAGGDGRVYHAAVSVSRSGATRTKRAPGCARVSPDDGGVIYGPRAELLRGTSCWASRGRGSSSGSSLLAARKHLRQFLLFLFPFFFFMPIINAGWILFHQIIRMNQDLDASRASAVRL